MDQGETMGAEHVRQIVAGLFVDGDAERNQALAPRFDHRLARVLHAVTSLIQVQVIGLAVGDQQQQLAPLRAGAQQLGSLTDSRAHARVVARLEALDRAARAVVIGLLERFEHLQAHLVPPQ